MSRDGQILPREQPPIVNQLQKVKSPSLRLGANNIVGTAWGIPGPDGPSSPSVRAGDDRVRHGNGSTRAASRTDKLCAASDKAFTTLEDDRS